MNISQLEKFLFTETESEKWHIEHPEVLSPVYDNLPKRELHGKEYYYFDFHNTLKTDLLGIVKESRYTIIPTHFHKDMELNYIYSGSCTFIVNDQEIVMEQGDLCILDANVVHSAISVKGHDDIVINMVFKKEFFDYMFLGKLSNKGILSNFLIDAITRDRSHNQFLIFHTKNNFKVHTLIQFLSTEYFDPGECYHELMETYSAALFTELINTTYSYYKKNVTQDNLFTILKYIETNYRTCTLTETAAFFGYNANYLSNYLKKNTGKSFKEIKLSQQMVESAALLTGSDLTVADISDHVGCTNLSYFYKKFYRIYKMTPKEYRMRYSGGRTHGQ